MRFWANTRLTIDYGFERLKVVKLREILAYEKSKIYGK